MRNRLSLSSLRRYTGALIKRKNEKDSGFVSYRSCSDHFAVLDFADRGLFPIFSSRRKFSGDMGATFGSQTVLAKVTQILLMKGRSISTAGISFIK